MANGQMKRFESAFMNEMQTIQFEIPSVVLSTPQLSTLPPISSPESFPTATTRKRSLRSPRAHEWKGERARRRGVRGRAHARNSFGPPEKNQQFVFERDQVEAGVDCDCVFKEL